jgi:AcrR family transcriptional regulator
MATSPATEPRPQRADARRNREAIVQAARAIVAEQGEEAQIHDVAKRAGVGVGTVYRHFPTKDALMGELIAQCARENADCARQALERDPDEAFAWMVRTSCDRMAVDAARRRVWNIATPEAFAHAEEAKQEMAAGCSAVIARAHEAGALRKDFTVDDMGGLMCGLAAAIDAGPPGGWERLVGFALDGLRAR